ncbi:MAG: ISAzo13-like element transposase-related protein, partial [Solirubrobacteraceae bacterium]
NTYERGIKIPPAQLAAINLTPEQFHGEWNYTISPQLTS